MRLVFHNIIQLRLLTYGEKYHYIIHYKSNVKTCDQCSLKACKEHSKSRFAFSKTLYNNCHFWSNGFPAAAKGSTEW